MYPRKKKHHAQVLTVKKRGRGRSLLFHLFRRSTQARLLSRQAGREKQRRSSAALSCGRAPACYHNDRQCRLVALGTCVLYCVGCQPVSRFSPLLRAGAELFLRADIAHAGASFSHPRAARLTAEVRPGLGTLCSTSTPCGSTEVEGEKQQSLLA